MMKRIRKDLILFFYVLGVDLSGGN